MKLREKPMPINEQNWYYEEPKGITLIHEVWWEGNYRQTDRIFIPWKRLLESVRRRYGETIK